MGCLFCLGVFIVPVFDVRGSEVPRGKSVLLLLVCNVPRGKSVLLLLVCKVPRVNGPVLRVNVLFLRIDGSPRVNDVFLCVCAIPAYLGVPLLGCRYRPARRPRREDFCSLI